MEPILKADSHDLTARIFIALVSGTLGMDEAQLGRAAAGLNKLDRAIADGERLLKANPHELYYENLLLIGHSYQAEILSSLGRQTEARAKFALAFDIANELAQKDPADLESRLNIAKIHVAQGVVLARARALPEANQEITTGLAQLDQLARVRPRDADIQFASEIARNDLAALRSCSVPHRCDPLFSMRMPEPNN
jgi:tetratricopeptide (TPR) repeat protein